MVLLGDANWWWPRWLDRLMPKMNLENGEALTEAEPEKVLVG
jgi:RND superfamily putative drug exporter